MIGVRDDTPFAVTTVMNAGAESGSFRDGARNMECFFRLWDSGGFERLLYC